MEQQANQTQDCKPTLGISDVAPISKLIFSVTKQMRRVFEQQARLQDMTLPQWRALGQLVQSDGLSQSALAALIETDPMTTSKILRLLETRGLIERLPDPADSRAKIVRATPPVTAMVEAMKAVAGELHETMLEGISEADREVLVRSLNKIYDNLAGQSDRQKDADK
jgi:DNA-binding MarR family transcriptional regulator